MRPVHGRPEIVAGPQGQPMRGVFWVLVCESPRKPFTRLFGGLRRNASFYLSPPLAMLRLNLQRLSVFRRSQLRQSISKILELRGDLWLWYSWVGSNHRPPVPQTGSFLFPPVSLNFNPLSLQQFLN